MSGLRHLHGLKIVHRDIKPQNILVSGARAALAGVAKDGAGGVSGVGGGGGMKGHRMLISDFGLCRKLEVDQTSFLPTANGMMGVGTVGWRAPEILRGEVKLDESSSTDDNSTSSRDSVGTTRTSSTAGAHHSHKPTRLTKSVDIFALGCLFYYVLTNGGHPFGDRYEREVNILKGAVCLEGLEGFGEEGSDAVDLIGNMLHAEASERYVSSLLFFLPRPVHSDLVLILDLFLQTDRIRRRVSCTRTSGIPVVVWVSFKMRRTDSRSWSVILEIHISCFLKKALSTSWVLIGSRGWTRSSSRIWASSGSTMGRACRTC